MPPDGEGGYTTWHRDMQDNQSVAVAHPTERVVKVNLTGLTQTARLGPSGFSAETLSFD